jgi:hypothetical protein
MWNEYVVLREAKKFPKPRFFNSQFDKWLHKATFWYQVFYFWMNLFFFQDVPSYCPLILQLEIEAFKLFDVIVSNFSLVVREVPNMISLFSHIELWRLPIWKTCFFQKFKPKDGIQRSKPWE